MSKPKASKMLNDADRAELLLDLSRFYSCAVDLVNLIVTTREEEGEEVSPGTIMVQIPYEKIEALLLRSNFILEDSGRERLFHAVAASLSHHSDEDTIALRCVVFDIAHALDHVVKEIVRN